MVANIGDIIGAGQAAPVSGLGKTAGQAAMGQDFASYIRDSAETAVANMHEGERVSLKAISGEANLTDVVAAVGNAEMTLQTISAVRDKLIQAYQAIIRMPI